LSSDKMSFNFPSVLTASLTLVSFWICCIFIKVKAEVEKTTSKSYEDFTAVKYRYQIVAGTNFIIKVRVGGDNYIHLSVNKHFSGTTMLQGVQKDKSKTDPVIYSCDQAAITILKAYTGIYRLQSSMKTPLS
uniref:Cystatin domain-containing protein n=1 Tax=Lates calcarifer TaxID=8187 RepID=A0A4W6DL88_LATCA